MLFSSQRINPPTTSNCEYLKLTQKPLSELDTAWFHQITEQRYKFYSTADQATRGTNPLKIHDDLAARESLEYLNGTINMAEQLPNHLTFPLPIKFISGLYKNGVVDCNQMNVREGSVVEMLLSKWVFVFSVYNSTLDTMENINKFEDFKQMKDSIEILIKNFKSILVRLAKFEKIYDAALVSLD